MKDRVLLARSPHLVLDGAALAAGLVGAEEIVMVVHRDVRRERRCGVGRTPTDRA